MNCAMRLLKVTLLFISSLTVMAGATVAPALPMMNDHFQSIPNAEFWTKLIITTPALFIALFSPIAGWLLDKFSKVRLILGFIILYATAGASGLVLDNIYWILVSRAFLGIAVSVIMTGATALVGDYLEGSERTDFLGMQGAFMAFGGTVFVTIAGYLAGISWRYPFGVYLLAFLILFLAWRVLYEPQKPENNPENAKIKGPESSNSKGLQYFIYSTIFIGMILFYIIPVQSPFLMRSLGAESGLMISLGLIVGTFFAAVASFFYNRVKRFFHFNQIYAILFTVFGLGFIGVGFAQTPIMVAMATAFACMGIGWLMPNTSLYLLSLSKPHNRGRIMGGMTGAVFLGQFFSPIALQPIVNKVDLSGAHFYAGGLSIFIGFIFLVLVVRKKGKQL